MLRDTLFLGLEYQLVISSLTPSILSKTLKNSPFLLFYPSSVQFLANAVRTVGRTDSKTQTYIRIEAYTTKHDRCRSSLCFGVHSTDFPDVISQKPGTGREKPSKKAFSMFSIKLRVLQLK